MGLKRGEVKGDRKRPHIEGLHDMQSSTTAIQVIKSRRMRWVGHVAHMGQRRDAYSMLVLKPEGKRHLENPRHRWENNIRTDLKETGWKGVDWIDLVQYRDKWWAVVNTVMNMRVP